MVFCEHARHGAPPCRTLFIDSQHAARCHSPLRCLLVAVCSALHPGWALAIHHVQICQQCIARSAINHCKHQSATSHYALSHVHLLCSCLHEPSLVADSRLFLLSSIKVLGPAGGVQQPCKAGCEQGSRAAALPQPHTLELWDAAADLGGPSSIQRRAAWHWGMFAPGADPDADAAESCCAWKLSRVHTTLCCSCPGAQWFVSVTVKVPEAPGHRQCHVHLSLDV